MTLKDFFTHGTAVEAKLTEAEVAALRMYTGPFYVPWNTALRCYQKDPSLIEQWAMCISMLCSAIFKLSFLSKKGTVYRGVNESRFKLPPSFIESTGADEFAAGVELAFMSTSTDINVAGEYAKRGVDANNCCIFEIQFDAASRGASVRWCSQFPYEEELIYPPCTYLTSEKIRVLDEGSVAGNDLF